MNYQRIYNQIIERAQSRGSVDGYCEKHHIVPKALGGLDISENLVELTAREHFVAHWLLARVHGGKMWYAFQMMCNMKNPYQEHRYTPSSRTFLEMKSNLTPSKESNEKRSKAMSGENHFMYGKKHSAATRRKMQGPKSETHKAALRGPRKPYGPQTILKCPYCLKEGGNAMKRWHFDNCAEYKN